MVRINLTPKSDDVQKTILSLSRVLYIPDALVNMISCTNLDGMGISTVTEDVECLLLDRQYMHPTITFSIRRTLHHLFALKGVVVRHHRTSISFSKVEVQ